METQERKLRTNLDTDLLKLVAIAAMLVDHIGGAFFPEIPVFRWIGRLAFPLFCYCLTVGLLLSMGCIAVGGIALGGVAVGWFAVGGVALGEYAIGGYAQAARIAAGGFARGAVAIGDETVGTVEFHHFVPRQEFYQAVRGQFPRIWQWIVDLFYACLG